MKIASRAVRIYSKTVLLVTTALSALPAGLCAQPPKPTTAPGAQHGFLALRNRSGAILASGDYTQIPLADRVKVRVIFHFLDGSLDDETTVFSKQPLRLISDRHIQRGRSFPDPIDFSIDMPNQRVSLRSWTDGKQVETMQAMELPSDLANGIVFGLVQALPPDSPKVEVPYLAPGAKPRLVRVAITPDAEESFKVAGRAYKAMKFTLKVNIGGLTGVIAPMIGKQPPDTHVWVLESNVPSILRIDGSLYQEGPIWSIRLASPAW